MPTRLSQMRWAQFPLAPLLFWHSYIDLVCLLLRLTWATRVCTCEMLPCVFAYDRTNYARYLSVCWSEKTLLILKNLHVNTVLESGQFAVQRSSNNAFAQSPVYQMIKQTMNRDTKTKGGINLNRGEVQRWILTVQDRAKTLQTCREMTDLYDAESKQQKDASVPQMK